MAKRVEVKTELTAEELHERYRQASEPVERTHWHILWLMKEGHTPGEVAERVGYTARWVRTIVGRYNRQGAQAISNHRLTLPGAKPLLTREQQQELDEALHQRPDDDGLRPFTNTSTGGVIGRATKTAIAVIEHHSDLISNPFG